MQDNTLEPSINKNKLESKIGILGGGQLGKMLVNAGSPMNLNISVMDTSENVPAKNHVVNFEIGDPLDYDQVLQFGKDKDVITIEKENVNSDALKQLELLGVEVHPNADSLKIIQDKGLQKDFYKKNGYPTASFSCLNKNEIVKQLEIGSLSFPFVLKKRKAGYDGNGVAIIKNLDDLKSYDNSNYLIEECIDIAKEVSLIAARNKSGQVNIYDATEVVTVKNSFLMNHLFSPAAISPTNLSEMKGIASSLIKDLSIQGLLAVEFMISTDGSIYVNEISPRPHNTGHHTIEMNLVSQYEQHLRGILDLPLGSCSSQQYALNLNIIGPDRVEGKPIYQGLEKVLSLTNVYIHIYGKKVTKPKRKLGHITIISTNKEELDNKMIFIEENFKVTI